MVLEVGEYRNGVLVVYCYWTVHFHHGQIAPSDLDPTDLETADPRDSWRDSRAVQNFWRELYHAVMLI